jgi:hypothetical protein
MVYIIKDLHISIKWLPLFHKSNPSKKNNKNVEMQEQSDHHDRSCQIRDISLVVASSPDDESGTHHHPSAIS